MNQRCKAVGVLISHGNEFLLCTRSPEARVLPGAWSVPAGSVETGERMLHAAIRELYEETRIPLLEDQLQKLAIFKDFCLFYHVSLFRYYPILDVEHVGYAYFNGDELPFPMDDYLRDQIKHLTSLKKPATIL